MPEFCHLHCHTQYSLLDGASDIGLMMDKAVKDGQKGVALTDHGNMFGAFKFVAEANKRNIKPIVGCEFYMVKDRHKQAFSRAKGEKDVRYHQLMLAKNQVGYHNLVKLCSLGYIEGMYGKYPRIDKELVLQYNEGIIATSCCIGAEIPQLILHKKHAEAEAALKWWLDIFGEDYYIEIQRHNGLENIDESGVSQEDINQHLLRLAKKYNVKVIATNDSHYVEEEDSASHDILLCVNTGNLLEETKRFKFPSSDFYFKTQAEMGQRFSDVPVSLDTTMEILDKIEPLQLARDVLLPAFPIPKGFETQDDFLRHLTYEGAKKRYGTITPEIEERLNFELETIRRTGYPGYFLIVQDFTTTAREIGVAVGPGRGSAAGSAVSYCIGITNVDPIKYDLLFERFLNPERVSMPDIDIDFDDEGRQKVIDYVVDKYGQKQVAQIITYGSMKAKSALRDVGRVMNIPLPEVDKVAKTFPDNLKASLGKVLAEGDVDKKLKSSLNSDELQKANEFRQLAEGNQPIAQMIRAAKKLEGSVRNTGVHACGVVITPDDVTKYVPVSMAKDNELYISQFDNSVAEDAGLLKMDFLGLKTLTIIKDAVQMIEENHGVKLDIDEVPLDDVKTYELFQRGETVGIFQYESAGMQKYMKELKPTTFNDLIAMNALYRPGPLEYIPNFINRKHGREEIVYDLDAMEEYLHETYGICVTGDTLVFNPKTGERTRLDEIADTSETFEVQGVDSDLNTKFAKVSYWVCNGKKEVLEVKLRNGSKVRLTPDHRVLTENGWREIGDLKVGDAIATPRKLEVVEGKDYDKTALKVLAEQQIIPEFVFSLKEELIAFFVGELWENGDFSDTSKIAYTTDSEKLAFDLQTLLLRLGITATIKEKSGTYQVIIANFKGQIHAKTPPLKGVRGDVRSGVENQLGVEFLRSSESINHNKPTNIKVSEESGQALTDLTIHEYIQLSANSNTLGDFNSQDSYRMTKKGNILSEKSLSFYNSCLDTSGNLVENINRSDIGQSSKEGQAIHWQEITSIEAVGKELVYDITVEDIHNFVGNNIILHNCVYQEQVMLLSQKLANFSKGEADVLRKAMGKKQKYVLDKMYPQFLEGGASNGHPKKILDKVWKDWEAFASYAFNKSHSTCYALVAFQTAYLKANYPAEFMAGVLSHNMKDIKKLNFFLSECNRMGLTCKSPDVNESNVKFAVNKKGEIRFAMAAVKGVGAAAVEDLIEERKKGGAFKDVFDIVKRVNLRTVNKKAFENLALAGAFDNFGLHRAQYFYEHNGEDANLIERIIRFGNQYQKQGSTPQMSLFGAAVLDQEVATPTVYDCEDWGLMERLKREREVTGIFLSGHPLDDYKMEVDFFCNATLDDIEKRPNSELSIGCIVMSAEHRLTKNGNGFGKFLVEDFNNAYELVLFGDDYVTFKNYFEEGRAVQIKGQYKNRGWGNNDRYEFKLSKVRLLATILEEEAKQITVSIPLDIIDNTFITRMQNLCHQHPGKLSLAINVIDRRNGYGKVELFSKSLKLDAKKEVFEKLKGFGEMRVKLN